MCLVLKLDNGKVVSIANGQNHRHIDRITQPSSSVLEYRFWILIFFTGFVLFAAMLCVCFFVNIHMIKYIFIIDWLLITKYFSYSPSSLWNSLHRSTGFMVWVFYLIEKKVHFCQMANMLTFCRLVDVYIFWKILEISGKLREFFSTALVDTMYIVYIWAKLYKFINDGVPFYW